MIPFKYILITLFDLYVLRWQMQKQLGASFKLRKKEMFEDGRGTLEFEHADQCIESCNNKRRTLLKIHFFINMRKKMIFPRANFCVIKQNLENIVNF